MKKRLFGFLISLLMLIPFGVSALSDDYVDICKDFVSITPEQGKVNLYFFRGDGCPYCEKELAWLDAIDDIYADKLNVFVYEIWNDKDNTEACLEIKEYFGLERSDAVPFTVIGNKYFEGFGPDEPINIENTIRAYLNMDLLSVSSYDYYAENPDYQQGNNVEADNQGNDANQQVSNISDVDKTEKKFNFESVYFGILTLGFFIIEMAVAYYIFVIAKHKDNEPYFSNQVEKDKTKNVNKK